MKSRMLLAMVAVVAFAATSCLGVGPETQEQVEQPAPNIEVWAPSQYGDAAVRQASGNTVDYLDPNGYPGIAITLTIKNTGSKDLTLTGAPPDYVELSEHDPDQYSVPSPPTSTVIPPDGSADFDVEFWHDYNYSVATAKLTIESDDPEEGDFFLMLTGVYGGS